MELLQLRYFKDAAELENFSAAAGKNFVPQPYISKTIKKLEDELGVKLFDRNGKRIILNGNGKYFYDKVSVALDSLDDGARHFSEMHTNIVLYPQAGARFVSMLIADYMTSQNDVFLSTVNYSPELMNNYDFTFMQPDSDMSNFDYVELMKDEIVCVVSEKHPLAKQTKPINVKDLSEESFVANYSSMNLRYFTDYYCEEVGGFRPTVIFETHDYLTLRYLIEQNRGIALLPRAFLNCNLLVAQRL